MAATALCSFGWTVSLISGGSGRLSCTTWTATQVDGAWRSRGGGGAGTFSASKILVEVGVGLHRLGGGSRDPVPLTQAIASPEVSSIELRSDDGLSERQPGRDGFCLLGITHQDPITYAHALDATGAALPGEPLLL
jgi:hypothetical protein